MVCRREILAAVFGDPLTAAAFPIVEFQFEVGDFAHATDLLFDVHDVAADTEIAF